MCTNSLECYNQIWEKITDAETDLNITQQSKQAKHFMSAFQNRLIGAVEISASQAAISLLGLPFHLSNESFWFLHFGPFKYHVKSMAKHESFSKYNSTKFSLDRTSLSRFGPDIFDTISPFFRKCDPLEVDDSEYETDGCSDEDAENEYESESENDADESDDITGPGNSKQQHRSSHQNNDEGVADIFIQSDKNIALVRQFDDYRYRGDSFRGFNAYEYTAGVERVLLPKSKPKSNKKSWFSEEADEDIEQVVDQSELDTSEDRSLLFVCLMLNTL